jgi:hypothetical protein
MNGKWLIALLPIVVGLLAIVPVIKADDITVTAEVPPYVSVVFNYNTVNFGTVSATGVTDLPAPNQDSGIYNVSVTTNVQLGVNATRTPWSPSDILPLKFAHGTTLPLSVQNAGDIGTSTIYFGPPIPTGAYTEYHAYWLTVPSLAPAGTYSTTVTITYWVV